ncbi:MAG: hypothetical protein WC557_01645 [Ignavibacteriaceae bacterium]
MATLETGHAKNVANFEDLISFCTGYGASYNPTKEAIKLTALSALHTEAQNKLAIVNAAQTPWSNAVSAREIVFEPLSKLITRVVNALDASEVLKQVVDNAKTIARKIQGKRAAPKNNSTPADPALPAEETSKNISASQMGFDNRIDNLDKLIQLLSAQTGYAPNETELSTAALATLLTNMKTTNTAAIDAFTPLSNSRIERNKSLYAEKTGLVDISADVKKYVKSVFGATSPQYKQVSGLKFTKPRE